MENSQKIIIQGKGNSRKDRSTNRLEANAHFIKDCNSPKKFRFGIIKNSICAYFSEWFEVFFDYGPRFHSPNHLSQPSALAASTSVNSEQANTVNRRRQNQNCYPPYWVSLFSPKAEPSHLLKFMDTLSYSSNTKPQPRSSWGWFRRYIRKMGQLFGWVLCGEEATLPGSEGFSIQSLLGSGRFWASCSWKRFFYLFIGPWRKSKNSWRWTLVC